MEDNKKFLKQFFETSKYQDRLEICDENLSKHIKKHEDDERNIARYENEEHLIDVIDLYQSIYDLDEGEEVLVSLVEKLGVDKEGILRGLEKGYKVYLNNFKELGGNISEYPKGLEDLVK